MTTAMTIFHFDDGEPNFEGLGIPNGSRTWREADLMTALGYGDPSTFRRSITRAMQACLSVGLSLEENFILVDGSYKLTRFGCYLVAMNADPKKPAVAAAQVYFATIAATFQTAMEHAEGFDRVAIREELTGGMKALSSAAKQHGVTSFPLFQNAGYRGMYNMDLARLEAMKSLPSGERLLDRMGRAELAANLFRITQTEAHIKAKNVQGQSALENAARSVGAEVRRMVVANTGSGPEHLPLAPAIREVKKAIKGANKNLKALDGKKKKKP